MFKELPAKEIDRRVTVYANSLNGVILGVAKKVMISDQWEFIAEGGSKVLFVCDGKLYNALRYAVQRSDWWREGMDLGGTFSRRQFAEIIQV